MSGKYRTLLDVVVAEENDIQDETEFYYADKVKDTLDDIESTVNEILKTLETYEKWTIEELEPNIKDIIVELKGLSKDLY